MPTVTVRDLATNTAAVIRDVEFSGRLAPVTRNGKPVAALVPVDKAALEDWLLTHAAEFARAAAAADADLAAGRARSAEWQRARRPAEDATGDGVGAGSESSPKHPRGPITSTDPATLPAPRTAIR